MSFMQPQVWETDYFVVENKYGETEYIDGDVVGPSPTVEDLSNYIGGGQCYNGEDNNEYYEDRPASPKARHYRALEARATSYRRAKKYAKRAEYYEEQEGFERVAVKLTPKHGWMAWLSAPGYMDRTEPSAFDTELEALEYLLDMYGNNDGGEPEDWEADVEERIKEIKAQKGKKAKR